ncbi:g12257 [Coccomyxa viridis]|uniref:G12257 protein n=1 Tax=Coccomyxa viridis TaxID=1274662 RepID=A0ABP1GFG4_9CHLO
MMPGMEQPGSLDECLELISYYQELYEHGLEFLEESRPRSVAKLKGTGSPSLARAPVDTTTRLGAVSVTREAKQKLQLLEGLKRVFEACEKDFENGNASLRNAPDDSWTWLGIVSLTREAGENVQKLEVLKALFQAQEAAAAEARQASEASQHRPAFSVSTLAAALGEAIKDFGRKYTFFKQSAWPTLGKTTSSAEVSAETAGAYPVHTDPLTAPLLQNADKALSCGEP